MTQSTICYFLNERKRFFQFKKKKKEEAKYLTLASRSQENEKKLFHFFFLFPKFYKWIENGRCERVDDSGRIDSTQSRVNFQGEKNGVKGGRGIKENKRKIKRGK